jgi:hypothetical protein
LTVKAKPLSQSGRIPDGKRLREGERDRAFHCKSNNVFLTENDCVWAIERCFCPNATSLLAACAPLGKLFTTLVCAFATILFVQLFPILIAVTCSLSSR